ncbi:MAG: SH3 domain-containing protein [Chloroflexi bacterium]|nr:SH3 domain-containing protein [Chloroflexota bacterium]
MIKQVLNRKVLMIGLAIASTLLCASLVYILIARPAVPAADPGPASAALTIIPAPTGTPRTLPPTLTSVPPTTTLPPTPAPGEFGLGAYVRVDTDALNLRSQPGLSFEPLFLAFDAEVFLITDGPRQADDFTWWYLTASYDAARAGWAAQDYLTVIPSP